MAVDFNKLDFSNMTDEELKTILDEVKKVEGQPVEPESKKVSVKLSDGSVIEAGSQEELNRLLAAKLDEYRAEPEPKPEPQGNKPPEWSMEDFTKKFLKDPREGIEYLETVKYGFPVSNMIPLLVAGMASQAKKLQELEAQRFIDTNTEYNPSVENRRVIENIMRERNWQPSYQTMQDAFDIARARGLVKTKEPLVKKEEERPFVPPRVNSSGAENRGANEELVTKAYGLPIEQLEELLIQSGVLKSRRMS